MGAQDDAAWIKALEGYRQLRHPEKLHKKLDDRDELLFHALSNLPAGGGGQSLSFVWRPGEPAPSGNVYSDWALLYADFNAAASQQQARTILIDDSLGNTNVPAGSYDLYGASVIGLNDQPDWHFLAGAVVTTWPRECVNLFIRSSSLAPVYNMSADPHAVEPLYFVSCDVRGNSGGAVPLFISGGRAIDMNFDGFDTSSVSTINGYFYDTTGGTGRIYLRGNMRLDADALTGDSAPLIRYEVSVREIMEQTNVGWTGGALTPTPVGVYEPCTHQGEAIVDTTVGGDYPLRRAFSTVSAALAAGFHVLRLREGQGHTWDASGSLVGDTQDIVIRGTRGASTLLLSGTMPLPAFAERITFQGVSVTQSGDFAPGRIMTITDCDWDGGGFLVEDLVPTSQFIAKDSYFQNASFSTNQGTGGLCTAEVQGCQIVSTEPQRAFLHEFTTNNLRGCDYFVRTTLAALKGLVDEGAVSALARLTGVTATVEHDGLGEFVLITATNGTRLQSTSITWKESAGGTFRVKSGGLLAPVGCSLYGADPADAASLTGVWHVNGAGTAIVPFP